MNNIIEYAIIKPNEEYDFRNPEKWVEYYSKYDEFSKNIVIHKSDKKNLFDDVINNIKLDDNDIFSSCIISHDNYKLYELLYISKPKIVQDVLNNKNNNNYNIKENYFGEFLTNNKQIIANNVAILVYDIKNNNKQPTNINLLDIKKLFYQKMYHKTVIVKSDNNISELELMNNIQEHLKQIHKKNIKKIEFNLLGNNAYRIEMFLLENNSDRNKIATKLYGKEIKGDVVITNLDRDSIQEIKIMDKQLKEYYNALNYVYYYSDFTIEEIKKLDIIYQNPEKKINSLISKLDDKKNNLYIKNKYYYLDNALKNLDNNCYKCNKKISNNKVCGRCYRIIYCSSICQISDWNEHKNNCL